MSANKPIEATLLAATKLALDELVWSATGPAVTSGSHAWSIEPRPGGCRVITEESQIGLVLFFLRPRTRNRLLASHEEWLRSLKERAEAHRD
jgi:hypothetical protein